MAAYAQTPIDASTAQAYYQNCTKQNDPRMTTETLDIFCQCTAMHMQKSLSLEEMQSMSGSTPTDRAIVNKVIVEVYAPCMEFPVSDMIFQKCQSDTNLAHANICTCLSGEMAAYTARTSQDLLADILREDPDIVDPMAPIVNSADFSRHEQATILKCIEDSL